MIPNKIIEKVKQKCGDDEDAYNAILKMLKRLDKGSKKNVQQDCTQIIEEYYKEISQNEN